MLFRSSTTIFTLSLLNLLLGLFVQIGLAATLGTGREMDALFIAISLPTFFTAVSLASCNSALVPFFKRQLDTIDPGRMARISKKKHLFFRHFLRHIVCRVPAGGILCPDRRTRPGPLHNPPRGRDPPDNDPRIVFRHSAQFSDGLFFFPGNFLPAAICYGIEPGVPAVRPAVAGSITRPVRVGLGLDRRFRDHVCAFDDPLCAARGASIIFPERSLHPAGERMDAVPAAFIVVLLQQITPLLDRLAASLLPTGAISYLGYAGKIPDVFLRTITLAIVLASFPRQSRQVAEKDYAALFDLAI